MSFFWPQAFWLLLVPAALALLDLTRRRRAARSTHPKILQAEADSGHLALTSGTASTRPAARARWRLWLGLALAVTALARPQWGRIEEPVFEQAREILIAVDLSRSMLADDVKPTRLDRAKLLITSLLERLAGERVGLVVFAGTAFLQSPLSADYEILREFLPALGPDYLPEGGTDYRALLETSVTAFGAATNADRYLIILSDGESQTGDWQEVLPEVSEKGIRVVGLGIGTAAGAMIPDSTGAFLKDDRGAVVLSRLNTTTLQELADRTGGIYVDASAWVDLAQVVRDTVETGRRGEFQEASRVRLAERFQWALAPAVLFLMWSFWREFPVHPKARALTLAPARKAPARAAVAALFAFAGLATFPSPARAQPSATAAAEESLAAPLSTLVGQLSQRDRLGAADYADLARTTLTYGQRVQGGGQPVPPGPVRDGLAAVDAGEAIDRTAADWATLRKDLEALLDQPPEEEEQSEEPPPEEEQEQQPQDQKQDSNQPQDENDPRGDPSDQNQDQDGQPQDQQNQNGQPQDQQNPGDRGEEGGGQAPPEAGQSAFGEMESQPPPPPPQGETQRIGGQPERRPEAARPPELAIPLQKLDQLRNEDSPAALHQLMQDPKGTPAKKGPDW